MGNIFVIIDKNKKRIYLTKERWKHIVGEHPDLSNKLEEIKSTILESFIITPSEYDEKVLFYHKYDKKTKNYLKVSVKYLNGKGFIITAFYTLKLSR